MKWTGAFTLAMLLTGAGAAGADEGMWLYNQPPLKQLKERYGFQPTPAWLDHVQKASVRFNSGGSGSFVSSQGLVMTNHHVAADALQKLSSAEHDYIKEGFYAPTREQEVRCLDLELNVLQSIEDVTARVNAAVPAGASSAQADKARRAVIIQIEQEATPKGPGYRSDVTTLFRGGKYQLYRYKRYTDVRLVFAPELSAAFFGGDTDNFEYPRHDLDVAFFHVYENGQPVHPDSFLKWGNGVKDGELVMVSGHPGRTNRLNTYQDLLYLRDHQYPSLLNSLRRREVLLNTYCERSPENQREAHEDLFGVQNSRKARLGGLQALQDPALMRAKYDAEQSLRRAVEADPKLRAAYGDAWEIAEKATRTLATFNDRYVLLEGGRAFGSTLFGIARDEVRMAAEKTKPNSDRLREYADSHRPSLEQSLFSKRPIYKDFETVKLADSLALLAETLGEDDPTVVKILAGKSPKERAAQLIEGTGLQDVEARKALAASGAISSSQDPMIQLALLVDPESRELRRRYEQEVAEPLQQAYNKIAQATLAVQKGDLYPDATFTLRLSYGKVTGIPGTPLLTPPAAPLKGGPVPYTTTFGGLFQESAAHLGEGIFAVPPSWAKAKDHLDLSTPLDFICTTDIIGGNSGSPVVDREGDLVGLIFDGNLDSLALDFVYSDKRARALAVDTRGILTALRQIYNCPKLADEIEGRP